MMVFGTIRSVHVSIALKPTPTPTPPPPLVWARPWTCALARKGAAPKACVRSRGAPGQPPENAPALRTASSERKHTFSTDCP